MSPSSFRHRVAGATLATAIGLGSVGLVPGLPAAAQSAECTTTFLDTAGDGRWEEPTNWTEQSVPSHDDIVCIGGEGDGVSISSSAIVGALLGDGGVDVLEGGDLRVLGELDLGHLWVTAGRFEVAGGGTVGSFDQGGGVLAGAGALSVTEDFHVSGGTQEGGSGITAIGPDAAAYFTVSTNLTWGDRQLVSDAATTEVAGAGTLDFGATNVTIRHLAAPVGTHVELLGTAVSIDRTGSVGGFLQLPRHTTVRGGWTVAPAGHLVLVEGTVEGSVEVDDDGYLVLAPGAEGDGAAAIAPAGSVTGDGDVLVAPNLDVFVEGRLEVGELLVEGIAHNAATGSIAADELVVRGTLVLEGGAAASAAEIAIEGGTVGIGAGANLAAADPVVLHDGVLELVGTLEGGLVQTAGRFTVAGDPEITRGGWEQTGGTLGVVADGDEPAFLGIDGRATLGGELELVAEPGALVSGHILGASGGVQGEFTWVSAEHHCPDVTYRETDVLIAAAPCLAVDDVVVDEDAGVAVVPVRLPEALEVAYPFTYRTADDPAGGATAGTDYEAAEGTATIPAGETSTTVEIALVDDDDAEDDETFEVQVDGATDASSAGALVTIIDDDEQISGIATAFDVVDLGALPAMSIAGSNANGLVGNWASDADTGGSWVYQFASGQRGDIAGFERSSVQDVNEAGQILGYYSVRARGGAITSLAPVAGAEFWAASAINEDGVIVGYARLADDSVRIVRWATADAQPELLVAPGARSVFVEDVDDAGTIVGYLNTGTRPADGQAFRWTDEDGLELLPELGTDVVSAAWAVSEGVIVGVSGGHAVRWDDGEITDLGPGQAIDVNVDGLVVGHAPGQPGDVLPSRATAWVGEVAVDLNALVPAPDGWFLARVETINDDGIIAGEGVWGGAVRSFFLEPYDCAICVEVTFDEPVVGGTGRSEITTSTVEGNPVRLQARLDNPVRVAQSVEVEVYDALTEEPLTEDPIPLTILPGGRRTIEVPVDTEGMAWSNGQPAGARTFEVVVTEAGTDRELAVEPAGLLVDPRPVVLVHGMWSDASTWRDFQRSVPRAHPRWLSWAVDTMDTSYETPNTIAENAVELHAYIEQVRRDTGAWSVDLVGHSMGGLISRSYIDSLMPAYDVGGWEAPVARKLVMLGTPNAGSPCAWMAPVRSTTELRPEVVAEFNEVVTERNGVEFSVGYGVHVPFTCLAGLPSDDVVPVISAVHGMSDTVEFLPMAHTDMTGSQEMFDSFVLPRLAGTAIVGADAGFAAASLVADDEAAAAAVADGPQFPAVQALLLDTVDVPARAATPVGFTVPAGTTDVAVTVVAPGTVGLELVDPSGAVVDAAPAEASSSGTPTQPRFRTLTAPATTGRWVVRIANPAATGVEVALGVGAVGLPIALTVGLEQVHWSGRLVVTADYTAPGGATAPAALTAELVHAEGTEEVQLGDDGQNGDETAGDGRYSRLVADVPTGPVTATVSVQSPYSTLTASAGLVVDRTRPPTNTAPVAADLAAEVGAGGTVGVTLAGTDADGDDLAYSIVDGPDHGTIGGTLPNLVYAPALGHRGVDTVTYAASDGLATSAPATITITTGDPIADIRWLGPNPREAGQGQSVLLSAYVLDGLRRPVAGLPVTFDLGGQVVTGTTGVGGIANAPFVIEAAPGARDLVLTTPAVPGLAAGRQVLPFTVLANRVPRPTLDLLTGGSEAGYTVRLGGTLGDADFDVVTTGWDLDGDGVVDEVGGTMRQAEGTVWLEHVFPEAYEGPVTLVVTDSFGQEGRATMAVDIAPHRPLGATRMLRTDEGMAIAPLDWDRTGRYVLGTSPIPGRVDPVVDQLVVLDRLTGTHVVLDGTLDVTAARLSPDGRHVTHQQAVPGSSRRQVVLRDLGTGAVSVVSTTSAGGPANADATPMDISEDGAFVLFHSEATNLGASCGGCGYVYRWERATGSLEVVSIGPGGSPVGAREDDAALSADGSTVAFATQFPGLEDEQIVVVDVDARSAEVASVAPDGAAGDHDSWDPELSEDGSVLAFVSNSTNLAGDEAEAGLRSDVFVRDLATGTTRSLTAVGGPVVSAGTRVALSGDGRWALFETAADTFVPGDTNQDGDVFRVSLATGAIERVSVDARDDRQADGPSDLWFGDRVLTCDGSSVLFRSGANDLVPGDTDRVDAFAQGGIVDCDAAEVPDDDEPDEEEPETPPTTPTTPTTTPTTPTTPTTEAPTPTTPTTEAPEEEPTPTTPTTPTTEAPAGETPTTPTSEAPAPGETPTTPTTAAPVVAGGVVPTTAAPATTAAPVPADAPQVLGADLARTGGDTSGVQVGALLVAGGALLVLLGRRRRRPA